MSSFLLWSCTQDVDLSDGGGYVIPEGQGDMTLGFTFEAATNALETRGVQGDLDFGIRDLTVFFYDAKNGTEDDNQAPVYTFTFHNGNGQSDFDVYKKEHRDPAHCEEWTYHGLVTIKDVEYGAYRIYGVANAEYLLEQQNGAVAASENEKVKYNLSEKQLRELKVCWDCSDNDGLPAGQYNVPDAMFGYFTVEGVQDHERETYRNVIYHQNLGLYEGNAESSTDHKGNNRAGVVVLNKRSLEVQAWLKRVVSKVTVGFDGTGLKSGVEVYIKSVSIVDAPTECYLGQDNSVSSDTEFVNDEELTDARLNIVYSDVAGANGYVLSKEYPAFPRAEQNSKIDPEVEKETNVWDWNPEWYDYVHGSLENTNPTWNDQPITLYFLENLQGVAEGNPKLQSKESNDHYASGGHGDEENPCTYYKDGKPYGTYVEVKAYYRNTKKQTQGEITYRFMLGKNIENDFNAERNHHYKLTLSFLGDANNVDWHIDYKEDVDYFRIPYNLTDGGEETGFSFADDTWYKNENWNHSWVWYAYDRDNNPIAEICKELIFLESNYTDRSTDDRKAYQVVTVYPMKSTSYGNYITDLENGIIAQVLECEEDEATNQTYKTKEGGAKIAMYYRYERPEQWKTKVNSDRAQNCRYTIKECELTEEIAKGNTGSHDNYNFVKYDRKTQQLTLVEQPQNYLLNTRPYQVADKNGNLYHVVKIGSAYWMRENMRATKLFTAAEILPHVSGTTSEIYDIEPYKEGQGEKYCVATGCVYFDTNKPMYKTMDGDTKGETYGYLYNLAAIMGSNDMDPYTMNDYYSYEDAKMRLNRDKNPKFDPNNEETWTLDPETYEYADKNEEAEYYYYYEGPSSGYTGDGGRCGGGLVQLEDRFLDRFDATEGAFNDGQLAPKGWHIPTGAYDRQDARYEKGNDSQPEDYYCWSFGHVWQDHQYLFFYLGTDFFRGAKDTNDRMWPETTITAAIKKEKRNLSGLSLLAIPANGAADNSQLSYAPLGTSYSNPQPHLEKAIIPYVTNSFVAYEAGVKDKKGNDIVGSLILLPPVFDTMFAGFSDGDKLESDEVFGGYEFQNFYVGMSKQYLPVRLVRNSFPESYAAQPFNTLDATWTWEETK